MRGDWNQKYWDKTANQAYHFWFFVAVTSFDGLFWAEVADSIHDNPNNMTDYDFIGSPEDEAPPPWNITSQPDKDLTQQAMDLGLKLMHNNVFESLDCPANLDFLYTDIGSWIRANLKG